MDYKEIKLNSHKWSIPGGYFVKGEFSSDECIVGDDKMWIVVTWTYTSVFGYVFYVCRHSHTKTDQYEMWCKSETDGKWGRIQDTFLPEEESWYYVEQVISTIRETYKEVYEMHRKRCTEIPIDAECMVKFVWGLRDLNLPIENSYDHWIDYALVSLLCGHYTNCDKELISKSVHELCEKLDNIANGTKK